MSNNRTGISSILLSYSEILAIVGDIVRVKVPEVESGNGISPCLEEILLPEKLVSLEDIAKDPAHPQSGPLGRFAELVARNMLRQGVTLTSSANVKTGIKVRLTEKGIDLDLGDKAIADLLLQHLQPRFRALLEGIV